jgi:hypothetical protein
MPARSARPTTSTPPSTDRARRATSPRSNAGARAARLPRCSSASGWACHRLGLGGSNAGPATESSTLIRGPEPRLNDVAHSSDISALCRGRRLGAVEKQEAPEPASPHKRAGQAVGKDESLFGGDIDQLVAEGHKRCPGSLYRHPLISPKPAIPPRSGIDTAKERLWPLDRGEPRRPRLGSR